MQSSSDTFLPVSTARLFRAEALEAQSTRTLGQIILTPRMSVWWLCWLAAAAGVAIVCFMTFGSYTRRVTVTGQLVPAGGVIRVQTPQAGVVLEKKVSDGQLVAKGDVLYVLGSDRPGLGIGEIQAGISEQVSERRRSMESEIVRNRNAAQSEIDSLERRAANLRAESEAVARLVEQQRNRLKIAEDARQRYQGLADRDYIAREQLYQKELEQSEQMSRMQTLQRDALVNQRELTATLRDVEATRARYANQIAALQRSISSAGQELTEVEGRRRVVITAPEAGRATLVMAEVGQAVEPTRPLAQLVAENAPLQARLYAPSRTIGFLRQGDQFLLRLQAFPYQKFGLQEGTVVSVSSSAASSAELAGFALPDTPAGEPAYSVVVALRRQSVSAYGEQRPLAAGMRLDADVLQENRRLYEWMLEPLFSITGKMK